MKESSRTWDVYKVQPSHCSAAGRPASLKRIQQGDRALFANEWRGGIDLDHRKPPAGGRNGVAFFGVGLLANPQRVEFRLKRAPIDHLRGSKFTVHVFHCSLR